MYFACDALDIFIDVQVSINGHSDGTVHQQLRNNRTGTRSTRTQIDHDVFEGLPVRHWRKAPVTVNAAPQKDNSSVSNIRNAGWPELPMPRDAHLLSPMSQALLRAARMGQVNKPPPPPPEDEKEPGEDEEADRDGDAGFVARRWGVVPRHLEGPEPEYLAKRRKGLPSVYTGNIAPAGTSGPMRKTKIRKTDANGNSSVWDVLVPEGHTVEGEIVEEGTTLSETPAPGTVVKGVGVVNSDGVVIAGEQSFPTPPKRRPPPPKRKSKGPGRGRRKRAGFVSITSVTPMTQRPNGTPNVPVIVNGLPNLTSAGTLAVGHADTDMGDDSITQDGEEGSEDEEDGEDGEDGDREEGELSPSPGLVSKSPSKQPIPEIFEPEPLPDIPELIFTQPGIPVERDLSSSPDLPLAASQGFQPPLIRIDPAQEAITVPAPELHEIPLAGQILVEEAPPPHYSSANVELPASHDPLNGLAEPNFPEFEAYKKVPTNQAMQFPDGEEDLLGSLERSLNGRGEVKEV